MRVTKKDLIKQLDLAMIDSAKLSEVAASLAPVLHK
jgi:hypothetical protein